MRALLPENIKDDRRGKNNISGKRVNKQGQAPNSSWNLIGFLPKLRKKTFLEGKTAIVEIFNK